MTSTEKRGKTAPEAVLAYCTSWTQGLYLCCWPTKGAGDATMEVMEETSRAVSDKMMAMLRHEIPEQDDTASASEPMRGPAVLKITGDLGPDTEPEIMPGSFLGTYGKLDINTAGHWTYRAGETGLREIKENGPDWFAHYDRFFVTHEDGSVQKLTISLCRRRNDKVEETTASWTVGDRVPAETFGENNEPDLRLATERDLTRKLPDPDQFDEPAPVPLWVEGRPGKGMSRREVTQDELRHLRLYPERDELSGGGLKFVGLLFFNAAERLPVDEMKGSDNAAASTATDTSKPDPYRTGSPGRPTIKHKILDEFQKRVGLNTFHLTLASEAEELRKWAKKEHPDAPCPTLKTIENLIRDEHRRAKTAPKCPIK